MSTVAHDIRPPIVKIPGLSKANFAIAQILQAMPEWSPAHIKDLPQMVQYFSMPQEIELSKTGIGQN